MSAQRRRWHGLLARAREALEPLEAEVGKLDEVTKQLGSVGLSQQAERAALRQTVSAAAARQPELLEQKQLAVSSRSFKEAGRLTAELKALAAEEGEHASGRWRSRPSSTRKVDMALISSPPPVRRMRSAPGGTSPMPAFTWRRCCCWEGVRPHGTPSRTEPPRTIASSSWRRTRRAAAAGAGVAREAWNRGADRGAGRGGGRGGAATDAAADGGGCGGGYGGG